MYHSTPETQTDESYTHAEDLEHFAQHEDIERKEAEKEAEYQGISVEEALAAHEPHDEPAPPTPPGSPQNEEQGTPPPQEEQDASAGIPPEAEGIADPAAPGYEAPPHPHDDQREDQVPIHAPPAPPPVSTGPRIQRQTPPEKLDPSERYKNAKDESGGHGEWGTGEGGYKIPKTPGERMRCV